MINNPFRLVAKQAILFAVFILACNKSFTQKSEKVYKAVYKVVSEELSLRVPDSVVNKIGSPQSEIRLPLGTILYTNYYRTGFTRTEINLETAAGVRGSIKASSFVLLSRQKDSALFLYEDDSLLDSFCYVLPQMKFLRKERIGNYECSGYEYVDGDTSKVIVWFSTKLPFWVSPGVYYNAFGGIVKIDYTYLGKVWQLELVNYEIIDAKIDFEPKLVKPRGKSRTHFIFKRA